MQTSLELNKVQGHNQVMKLNSPSDWCEEELGKAVKKKIRYGIVQTGENLEEGVPCLRVIDLEYGIIDKSKLIKTSVKISQQYRDCILEVGDIVFALRGEIGKVILIDENLAGINITRGVARISAKSEIDSNYLYYQLQSPSVKSKIALQVNGTSLKEIPINGLKKVVISSPKFLQEQRAIAAILSTWDKGIEKLQQLITAKQKRKKSLMQQLLTGKKRFKEFTSEWQEVKYGDILKKVSRPVIWDDEELFNLISVRRRSGGLFHRESLYGYQILTKSLFTAKAGDFLISKMQILHGASGLTTEEFDGMKISGSYISVVAKNPEQLDMEFFSWLSKLPYFYHQTYIASCGVHIEKMTFDFKTFLKLSTHLPSTEEQRKIVNVLNASDKEIETLQQKLSALKQQKKGLMQKLLTGQVRVKRKL
ncbi:restriction endonuclease subunit S [Pontibacter sp. JH31]|uniref:Restriction endonuclease subunit S n=1 Tax=Pontibacter aquaedesilientis TaxID=2766980 RepID=A0ABR7XEM9_9BACT|nr:restriction endonuclease subunit S [Pontibacter aquaedesilientis]MBD1396753.1 restriction endonuclease subunit S [Pontibacter aquaedesilientis]